MHAKRWAAVLLVFGMVMIDGAGASRKRQQQMAQEAQAKAKHVKVDEPKGDSGKAAQDAVQKKALQEGQYAKHMDGVKLYLKLKGRWNETSDLDLPIDESPDPVPAPKGKAKPGRSDCPKTVFPHGCITLEKMASFLDGKWIPGFEAAADPRFVEPGHFFQGRAEPANAKGKTPAPKPGKKAEGKVNIPALQLMNEMVLYILSRPQSAVPDQVQPYFNDPGTLWPGSSTPTREPFLPPADLRTELCTPSPVEGAADICVPYREQDIEGAPKPLKSEQELKQEEMDEEGELANSAAFRQIFYLAMALMGIIVPASIGYFCIRAYLNSKVAFKPYNLVKPRASDQTQPVDSTSRVEDLRKKLLATNTGGTGGLGLASMGMPGHQPTRGFNEGGNSMYSARPDRFSQSQWAA